MIKLTFLFCFFCQVVSDIEITFYSSITGENLTGYITVKRLDTIDYIFPDENNNFKVSIGNITSTDSLFFHCNLTKTFIKTSTLKEGKIYLDLKEKLDEVFISPEKTFYDGVNKSRKLIHRVSPKWGVGYVQKLFDQRNYFISSIEIKVINRHAIIRGMNSFDKEFEVLLGKANSMDSLMQPEILFTSKVRVLSKSNGWIVLELDNKINLSEVDYLFLAVRGLNDFFSIAEVNTKKYPEIKTYIYQYLSDNEWKQVENLTLPAIRYKLSDKAN